MVSFFNQIPNDTKKVQSINVLYSNVDNMRQMCPVQVSDATISHGFGSNGKRETLEQAITRAPQIGSTEGGRVKKISAAASKAAQGALRALPCGFMRRAGIASAGLTFGGRFSRTGETPTP